MEELELKFLIDQSQVPALRRRAQQMEGVGKPTNRTLRAIYYDTPDQALHHAGHSLRVRKEGRAWQQTLKIRADKGTGLSTAIEISAAAPGGRISLDLLPDEEARRKIEKIRGGQTLQPVVETVIRRSSILVQDARGKAEIAFDRGEISAAGKTAQLTEMEIELVEGDPAFIFAVATRLLADQPFKFSMRSKFERGLLLAVDGVIEPVSTARAAEDVELKAAMPADDALRSVLRECFEQIALNVDCVLSSDVVEGPHQLRVGLRRLRSFLAAASVLKDSPQGAAIAEQAKWLGQEVGKLRDLDVAEAVVREYADRNPQEPCLNMLAARFAGQAAARRAELRVVLASDRTRTFLLQLIEFAELAGWRSAREQPTEASMGELAEIALGKRARAALKKGRGFRDLKNEQRHDLRKELKKLRYVIEFFGSLYSGKAVKAYVKRLKRIQEVFGQLNDAQFMAELLSPDKLDDSHELHRAAGWVLGAITESAATHMGEAHELWKDFKDATPFWKDE